MKNARVVSKGGERSILTARHSILSARHSMYVQPSNAIEQWRLGRVTCRYGDARLQGARVHKVGKRGLFTNGKRAGEEKKRKEERPLKATCREQERVKERRADRDAW